MAKAVRLRMQDAEGNNYIWTAKHEPRMCNIVLGKKPRIFAGWQYVDHDGCARTVEGNWLDLVASVRLTAANYGFTTNVS